MSENTTLLDDHVTPINLTFGIVGFLASFSGIFLNALSVPAFYKVRTPRSPRPISNNIYLMMVATDVMTSLSMVPFCVSRLYNADSKLYDNVVVCNTAGVLFSLGSQLSVLSVALQSIMRTHSLLLPLREIKILPLKLFCFVYLAAQLLIAALPFLGGKQYKYYPSVTSCNFSLREIWDSESLEYKWILMFVGILPFLWPAVPILISCILSVVILMFRDKRIQDQTTTARCRHASVTIVIVTVLYIALNIPYWNYLLVWLVDFQAADKWFNANDPHHYIYTFLNPFSMLLNSGINPLIYLVRMRSVRETVLELFKGRDRGRREARSEVLLGGQGRLLELCEITPTAEQCPIVPGKGFRANTRPPIPYRPPMNRTTSYIGTARGVVAVNRFKHNSASSLPLKSASQVSRTSQNSYGTGSASSKVSILD